MSRCQHFTATPVEKQYHVPLGSEGIDCCVGCYVTINPPNDIAVFTMLNRAFLEQRIHDHREAEWLLAEKDHEINELRDEIEIMEAEDLP